MPTSSNPTNNGGSPRPRRVIHYEEKRIFDLYFACIPAQGRCITGMKRGTSLLVYFCLFIMLGAIISPLVVGVAVVYMFSLQHL